MEPHQSADWNVKHHSFCEEDYALVFWAAEFVNSFTNLAYGMWFLVSEPCCSPNPHPSAWSKDWVAICTDGYYGYLN